MSTKNQQMADDAVRASYITSLFENPASLLVGAVLQAAVCLLVFFETQSYVFIGLMVMLTGVAGWRYKICQDFLAFKPDLNDYIIAKHWENKQLAGLSVGCSFIGLFAVACLYVNPNTATQLAATVLVLSIGASLLAKYYGSKKLITISMVCTFLPFVIGLFLSGNMSLKVLAVISVPFLYMLSLHADSLRKTLFDSARGRVLLAEIADKFNAALNNMPHGLLMIDEACRIEVANKQFFKVMGFEPGTKIEGHSIGMIFTIARRRNLFASRETADIASRRVVQLAMRETGGAAALSLSDGRSLQIVAKKRAKGGAVLIIEDVTARVAAEAKIEKMARFDELTGLQNRAFFRENVEAVLSSEKNGRRGICAHYAIDVDEFKGINDVYGHATGDNLLQALAINLSTLGKRNLFVCRNGGDEFSVFAYNLPDAAAAEALAGRIAETLNVRYDLPNCRYIASVSIGYATSTLSAAEFQALIIRSDLALYARKADKRAPYRAYEDEMDRQQRERLQLKSDLGAAIRDGALHLVFQPVIDMNKQRMTSCEALVRWNHPTLGLVSPGVFVPLAEEMGIVSDMTLFVIAEACRACAAWPDEVGVSVNLSAIDFERPQLFADIVAALKHANLSPSRLEVEITETAAIKGLENVTSTLKRLRAFGVRTALDDFGVGFSGLSHLHSLPLDRVKIDRSFILAVNNNERSLRLLSSVISMAAVLDLKVTVEGIEDIDTLERVMAAGAVEKVQGFVFGRHMSAVQIGELSRHVYSAAGLSCEKAKVAA